jgi:hypothetical protein
MIKKRMLHVRSERFSLEYNAMNVHPTVLRDVCLMKVEKFFLKSGFTRNKA